MSACRRPSSASTAGRLSESHRSMALPLVRRVLCTTLGVTFRRRHSATKQRVSSFLSAPTVILTRRPQPSPAILSTIRLGPMGTGCQTALRYRQSRGRLLDRQPFYLHRLDCPARTSGARMPFGIAPSLVFRQEIGDEKQDRPPTRLRIMRNREIKNVNRLSAIAEAHSSLVNRGYFIFSGK